LKARKTAVWGKWSCGRSRRILVVARERRTITVIIPDASPLLSLARVGRLDVFRHFVVTIQIVDMRGMI
jgi:hypothetical protein